MTVCCPGSTRPGLTLIEVVAAIAILGTILAGVVLAKARHTRQLARAERTVQAVRAADELIAGWWARPEGVPAGDNGRLGPGEPFTWQTFAVPNDDVDPLGVQVVRVEVRDPQANTARNGEPLFVVDLVLPRPVEEPCADQSGEGGSP